MNKVKIINIVIISIMLLIIALNISCFKLETPDHGEIAIMIMSSDANDAKEHVFPEVEAIWISITKVEIHKEDTGWVIVVDNGDAGIRYNLFDIAEDAVIVGISEFEPGIYTQIRLILGENNTIMINNGSGSVEHDLIIPGGGQTGIKLSGFEITQAGRVRITLDFLVEESIIITGNEKYKLKPTINIIIE